MTRVMFFPNDRLSFTVETQDSPEWVEQQVNEKRWNPPEELREWFEQRSAEFSAVRLGELVIILPRPVSGEAVQGAGGDRSPERASPLNERQLVILRLVAEGLTDKQIATRMKISQRNVQHQMNSIKHRLGASNRAQSMLRAAMLGLLGPRGRGRWR